MGFIILSIILVIIVAVGVGVIVNSQWELCRPEQLNELKTCRLELRDLYEVKGKYEQNIKEANSNAVVKKADDLIVLLSKREEMCDKRLREAEIEARQLIREIAALVQQKEQLNSTYRSCVEHLEACKYKTE